MLSQRQQVAGVVHRVLGHARGKRTLRPIRFLRTFHQFDVEIFLYQRGQTKLTDPNQPGGKRGIEDSLWHETHVPSEQSQIVISAVENDFLVRERVTQWRKIDIGQWIDNRVAPGDADLEQTKLLAVAVQTVGLGIDGGAMMRLK